MKKSRVLSLALAAALLVTSVAAGPDASAAKKKAKKVSLSKKNQTLYVGKSVTIKVKNGAKKAKVTWSLSNKKKYVKLSKKVAKGNMASVKVTAKKKGKVNLVAKYKLGKKTTTLKCKFTIKKKNASTPTAAPVLVPTAAPTNPVVPPIGNPTAAPTATQPANAGDPTAEPTDAVPTATATAVAPTATATATAAPTPTATAPVGDPTPTPTVNPQLDHTKAKDNNGKTGVINDDGSVTFTDVELVLIPLNTKYSIGDKLAIKINGTVEGDTPRTWISQGAWTACSNIVSPYTMGDEAVVTISKADGDSVQIKKTGSKFTKLTITSVYVYPYTESDVSPSPSPTPTPTPTPAPVEIEGKEINIDGVAHYEYSAPASAKSIEINANRNGETYTESVDIETFDAVVKMLGKADVIYDKLNGNIYDTVDTIAKQDAGNGVFKEVGNAVVTIKKETATKASVTVDNNGKVQKVEAEFVKTAAGYDVTVTAQGKNVVVKVDKDAKNKVVIVKGDKTYTVEAVVTKENATTFNFDIATETGRRLTGTVENSYADGKTWNGRAVTETGREIIFTYDVNECDEYVYTIEATCDGNVVSLVKTESGIVVRAPKKLVDKVNGKLEDKEVSYKIFYVE